ncbi:UvrD-helicase domain-containing protein [Blautia sp. AF26-2]|uniref:UvrD-helicase domain-containing protein n=1 Tax=Blautia sp. AF26-2 TaxID=2292966 RepID=UPI000E5285F7|nr:UvrD-helicase domain-containing protein [Blautia sp. AF26-2]RGG18972.1 ATP-dependent helicase [Blautia sp. AF26-2]
MADAIVENLFLVNAPAGSGKTTWIRKNVRKYLLQNPNDNVLCITYTNRAAEELGKDVDSNRVYFGTIHSFINDFIGSFFSHESILELYWEVYKNQIVERIENISQNGNWAESNMRYIEKYGGLTPEIVRSNITMISYNQAPFNALYRGALGHDDLISFTRLAVERFPVIKKKISDKYQVIFIDEYQDTATDVLQIFYSSMIGKKSKLYLLGDKMQQIYRNYNGEFETYFNIFNKSINLSVNYRTTPKIVSILNKIYNDECYKQTAYEKNKDENMDFLPEVRIVTDIEKNVSELMEQYKDSLILYLSNKSRFYNIGVGELYDAYSGMEKYSFGKKYNAVDVLTKEEIRENDALLSFLFTVNIIVDYFTKEFYGEVFRIIRKAGTYFNCEKFSIRKHIDKHLVKDKLDDIVALYNELSTTVDDFLSLCVEKKYIREEFYSAVVEENDYQLVKNVKVQEVKVLADYMSDPKISTQHGVKGESHDTVVFVADNSRSNPVVHMSKFFEMWSNIDITLSEFDAFYYIYSQMLNQIENKIGMKCSQLKADTYISVASIIDEELQAFTKKNETNPYYIQLLKVKMDKYFGKKNVTNVKECLKEGTVYGPLCAYRLFYVGCSRAKRNLVIMINKKDIEGFEDKLRNKLMITGFNVL